MEIAQNDSDEDFKDAEEGHSELDGHSEPDEGKHCWVPIHAQSLDVESFAGLSSRRTNEENPPDVPADYDVVWEEQMGRFGGETEDRVSKEDKLADFTEMLIDSGFFDRPEALEMMTLYGGEKTCLVRFLSARDGDLKAAHEMLEACLQWRSEEKVDAIWQISDEDERIDAIKQVRPWWTGTYMGLTRDGSPVQYSRIEFLDAGKLLGFGDEPLTLFYIWWMENSLGLQRIGQQALGDRNAPMPRSVEVYDCYNISMAYLAVNIPGLNRIAAALSLGQLYYPENLRKAFIINAPRVFTIAWNVLKRVLPSETLSKVIIRASFSLPAIKRSLLVPELIHFHGPQVVVLHSDGREELREFLDDTGIDAMFQSVESPEPPPE